MANDKRELLLRAGAAAGVESYVHEAFEFSEKQQEDEVRREVLEPLTATQDDEIMESSSDVEELTTTTIASTAASSTASSTAISATNNTTTSSSTMTTISSTKTTIRPTIITSTAVMLQPTTITTTPTTAPAAPKLSPDVFNVTLMVGLEFLGPLRVLVDRMPLGVPSLTTETSFHPFEGVEILIPAGAWVESRRSAPAALTLSIFQVPASLVEGVGGEACGLAMDLGPRGHMLAKPILISVPCSSSAEGQRRRVYFLNPLSRKWAADEVSERQGGGGLWAQTMSLGTHAGVVLAVGSTTSSSPSDNNSTGQLLLSSSSGGLVWAASGLRTGEIVGWSVGAVALVSFILVLCYHYYYHGREKPEAAGQDDGPLPRVTCDLSFVTGPCLIMTREQVHQPRPMEIVVQECAPPTKNSD